ncbi:MAG: hypothetical protein ABI183_06860 [Polyangiaceae bacterium]
MAISQKALLDLHVKYMEMRRLRILAIESPTTDPKEWMAELAARFPGALREIDELPLLEIDAKLAALSCATSDPTHVAPWMEATSRFHELTRGVLVVKRWLAGKKEIAVTDRAEFERIGSDLPHGADAIVWLDHLDAIANPPRGRVTDLVFARLATELAVSAEDVRRLVFK